MNLFEVGSEFSIVFPFGCFGIVVKSPRVGGNSPHFSKVALSAARTIFSGFRRCSLRSVKLRRVYDAPETLQGQISGNFASFGCRRARGFAGRIGVGGRFFVLCRWVCCWWFDFCWCRYLCRGRNNKIGVVFNDIWDWGRLRCSNTYPGSA